MRENIVSAFHNTKVRLLLKSIIAIFLVGILAISSIFIIDADAYTYSWSTTSISSTWGAVSSSNSGDFLFATRTGDYIYRSTDNGASWVQQTAGLSTNTWTGIDSSADGSIVFAAPNPGTIYRSIDSGVNWTSLLSSGLRNWVGVATSSSGQYVAGIVASGDIYVSNDYGDTWNALGLSNAWTSVTMSATGEHMFATGSASYKSDNFGVSWSSVSGGYGAAAYSGGGQYLYASNGSGLEYSTDYGASFNALTVPGGHTWISLSTSTDGDIVVAGSSDDLYVSPDFGLTWNLEADPGTASWASVANSVDGQKVLAAGSPSVWFGNIASTTTVTNVTIDPLLTPDGIYGFGDSMQIEVTFSDDVTVVGTPVLNLVTTSPSTTSINYASGSGSDTLIFDYTVAVGNMSSGDLAYTGRHSLLLNEGNIVDTLGNQVSIVLPTPGSPGSLNSNRHVVIDTSGTPAPTILDVTVDGGVVPDGTYGPSASVIPIKVTFSASVDVVGLPTISLGTSGNAIYASGSGSAILIFNYDISPSDVSMADLDYSSAGSLSLPMGASIKDSSTSVDADLTLFAPGAPGSLGANRNIAVDGDGPVILEVTSTTANGTYGPGASAILIKVSFDESVTVSGGTPSFLLNTGPGGTYVSGSGTDTLTYSYTISSGDSSVADLDYSNGSFSAGTSTMLDAYGNDADLTSAPLAGTSGSLGFNKDIAIDTTAPVIAEVTPVSTPSTNTTPSYTFSSTEAGIIHYSGGCTSSNSNANVGSNTINFSTLTAGTYSSCQIYVTDAVSIASNTITVSPFTITQTSSGGGGGCSANCRTEILRCTDTTALNFGGALPCTYPVLTCSDAIATNYGSALPCVYLQICKDKNATNYSLVGSCKYTELTCEDRLATNFGQSLPCKYPDKCLDTNAINYQSVGACDYQVPLCEDKNAENYGGELPCVFPEIVKEKDGDCVGSSCEKKDDDATSTEGGGGVNVFDCNITEAGDSVFSKIIHGARLSYCQTVKSVKVTKTSVKEILISETASNIEKTISTVGVVGGAAVSITTTLFLNPISFSELFLIPIRIWSLLMTALGLKKRRRPWGTVYDSITKQPLDPAYVTLRTADGKDVVSSLTDLDGRYGFIVPAPGMYALVATKTNYKFPSQKLVGRDHDELYRDLYFGEFINVVTPGEVVIRNIPMDPEKFDWNEFAKKDQKLMRFYSSRNKLLFRIADIFFGLGFTVASIAVITAPKTYNLAIFAMYIGVFLLRKFGIKARPFGHVVERQTSAPLSYGIIRISSVSTNVEIMHRITDAEGKYYCLLPNGQYYVRIDKKLSDGTYQTLIEKVPVVVTKGYLAETFEL